MTHYRRHAISLFFAIAFSTGLLTSCASVHSTSPQDPYEHINRKVFAFNDFLDRWLLKPAARSYRFVAPDAVDDGVSNFFNNLAEIRNLFNSALQGDMKQAGVSTGRFVVNTTIGLAGIFDVATAAKLPERDEDFGQTLGKWGVKPGPYIVLPLLGSSTIRDAAGRVVDIPLAPQFYIDDDAVRIGLYALDVVDSRADLLDAETLITGDRYTFIRELYLQDRKSKVTNGNTDDVFADDFDEGFEEDF